MAGSCRCEEVYHKERHSESGKSLGRLEVAAQALGAGRCGVLGHGAGEALDGLAAAAAPAKVARLGFRGEAADHVIELLFCVFEAPAQRGERVFVEHQRGRRAETRIAKGESRTCLPNGHRARAAWRFGLVSSHGDRDRTAGGAFVLCDRLVAHRAAARVGRAVHRMAQQGDDALFYTGLLHFNFGALIVAFHNVWSGLPMMVTLLGCGWTLKDCSISRVRSSR